MDPHSGKPLGMEMVEVVVVVVMEGGDEDTSLFLQNLQILIQRNHQRIEEQIQDQKRKQTMKMMMRHLLRLVNSHKLMKVGRPSGDYWIIEIVVQQIVLESGWSNVGYRRIVPIV